MFKYDLGKMVWTITEEPIYNPVECNICGGTGYIDIKGESFDCPKCFEDLYSCEGYVWTTSEATVIGRTYIEELYIGEKPVIDITEQYKIQNNKMTLRRDVSGLFLTKEEADQECVKRNKESS